MASSPRTDYSVKKPRSLPKRKRALKFERKILLLSLLASAPGLAASLLFIVFHNWSVETKIGLSLLILLGLALFLSFLHDAVIRPLQTLANVVSALREEDYSFRARGQAADDAMGELALEVNSLANLLSTHRTTSMEATAMVTRILEVIDVPLLAFDPDGNLRLANTAAERLLKDQSSGILARLANRLKGDDGTGWENEETFSLDGPNSTARWLLRRSQFRQNGIPHTLIVLSDVSRALREEERVAWQRLIRVMGHELNNSLTPIKSIAGSLASRMSTAPPQWEEKEDFSRGLAIIEARSASLNRFLQAYRQVAQMPQPTLRRTQLRPVIERVAGLEFRMPVQIELGPDVELVMDPDQVEQMLINLVRNAVEAALAVNKPDEARVRLSWACDPMDVEISVTDNGPGLLNPENVFVPFYTTKQDGSGIGLVLSRQIAEVHRGRLRLAERKDEGGCLALITLPRNL